MDLTEHVVGPLLTVLVLLGLDRLLERLLDPDGTHGRRRHGILGYGYLILCVMPFVGLWGFFADLHRGRSDLVVVAAVLTAGTAVAAVFAVRYRFGLDRR